MTYTIIFVLLAATVLIILSGLRASKGVTSLQEYFSFGDSADPSTLQRAFTVTNASFTTSFVTLFFLGLTLGISSIAIPLGFVIGIVAYVSFLLPRKMAALAQNRRFPSLIEEMTGSRLARTLVSLVIAFSLFLFTFAELQGLQLFLSALLVDVESVRNLMPPVLVTLMAWYTSRSGYRAVIGNDRLQFYLLVIGTACIFLLCVLGASAIGPARMLASGTAVAAATPPFETFKFIAQAIVGFVFAQLIYYDNWQRLAFYVTARMRNENAAATPDILRTIQRDIQKSYLLGAAYLLVIYAAPIVMALQLVDTGDKPSFDTLALFFTRAWSDAAIFDIRIGPVLVTGALLFMLAALISTAEVYIVGLVNTLIEDVLFSPTQRADFYADPDALRKVRFITAFTCFLIVPLLFIEPDFQKLFDFMFYSANGFVGPVLCAILLRRCSQSQVLFSIAFGFLYAFPALLSADVAARFPVPGVVIVFVSIVVCNPFFAANRRAVP
jgi:Na+/proline symporter